MNKITVRNGKPDDADHFVRLIMYTAPGYLAILFGPDPDRVIKNLFCHPNNLFSHTHSRFLEADGEVAGMTLFYDKAAMDRGVIPFLLLLAKNIGWRFIGRMGFLLRISRVFTLVEKGDMYSSNSALYPKFRAAGLGAILFGLSEKEARAKGLKRVVVDVKDDNIVALSLRRKLGYEVAANLKPINACGKAFKYLRLVKNLTEMNA